jgi:antitoxin PrlF
MIRRTQTPAAFSKLSAKSRTVIPRAIPDGLGLKPGDTLRYRLTEDGALLDKVATHEAADPFAAFSEWSSEGDERSYRGL